MSYTDKYSDIEQCGCGEASVEFKPFGAWDQFTAKLINCQSKEEGHGLVYICSNCGSQITDADPSMIASETVTDSYTNGKYMSPDPNQRDLEELIAEMEAN